jgi:hypothetical protein
MSKGIYKTVPNTDLFISLNEPPIGTALNQVGLNEFLGRSKRISFKLQGENTPKLFQPLTIRNTTFKNRIWVVRTVGIAIPSTRK